MYAKSCRICSHKPLTQILKLGKIPLVNYFPVAKELSIKTKRYPLNFCLCEHCGLAQLDYVIPPRTLFKTYHYLTSASNSLIDHFHELASECVRRHFLKWGDKALDVGANDGTLLFEFQKRGIKTLGVDPSRNAVAVAQKRGIKIIPAFFGEKTAERIRARRGTFHVITGNNVFAHVADIKSFLKGVKILLEPNGVFIAEFAHVLEIIVKNQFDVIYHEHVSYFSLIALMKLFNMFNFEIFDAKKILTQGGSLRIYVRNKRKGEVSLNLKDLIREEEENHITEVTTLKRFSEEVHQFREDFCELIFKIKKKKKKIVGFGAPAKGVTLLSFCGIGASEIDYIVDSTFLKQGRFFPGIHVPVYAEEKLATDPCDYLILLAWNFQEEILNKIQPLREKGVKVIIPFPKLRVV
ncbi:MAG: class I SAM-dependent methyltransferase [Candidatus Omnitrophica bacterium]|nr:class I SAM-dependent methyltransferase [Candidatus Omnitrophota bacterium]